MPRRLKIDQVVEQRILQALRKGATRRAAAGYGRVNETTMQRMIKRNAAFAAQVELAESEVEVDYAGYLRNAARAGDTRAMIFWLERRRPAEWGSKIIEADADLLARLVRAFTQPSSNGPALPGDIEVLEAAYAIVEEEQG